MVIHIGVMSEDAKRTEKMIHGRVYIPSGPFVTVYP